MQLSGTKRTRYHNNLGCYISIVAVRTASRTGQENRKLRVQFKGSVRGAEAHTVTWSLAFSSSSFEVCLHCSITAASQQPGVAR